MKEIGIEEYNKLIASLNRKIRNKFKNKTVIRVYGVPKNGSIIASSLSHYLWFKVVDNIKDADCIVDDLIDSGRTKERYTQHNRKPFFTLITKKSNEWIHFWFEKDVEKDAEDNIVRILEHIGENPNREGLIDTPKRVVKMWSEIFRGYNQLQKPNLTVFNNGADGLVYDEMICDEGNFYSHCEHHMVPFFGKYWFAYIPNKKILGISKVARLIDFYSAKLQIQERLVKEVLDEIEKTVCPLGCALLMKGEHLCKTMRGVKKKGKMITCDLRGVFKKEAETRAEFMRFIE